MEVKRKWNPVYSRISLDQVAEFDRITAGLSSQDQFTRICARLRLSKFIDRYGQEKCQRLFEIVRKADAAQ